MFDKIKFEVYEPPISLTVQAFEDAITKPEQEHSLGKLTNRDAKQVFATSTPEMQGLEFVFDGKVDVFHIPPVSQYAQNHLYYLCDFSVFHWEYQSFTTRTYYPHHFLVYTYRGYGTLEYKGKTYHLGEGDGFFIDGKIPHTYRCAGQHWTYAVADINGPLISKLYEQFCENGSPLFTQPINGALQQGLEKLLDIYSTGTPYRDWQASACIDSFLTNLMVQSLENASRSVALPQNMQYLIQYIESNYVSDLTMDSLSKFSGISRSHLTREFKKYTGYTPNAYIIQLRLAHAKRLLGSGTIPISTVAFNSGFNDINNFTNLFKKDTGMTPGAYRKQFSKN